MSLTMPTTEIQIHLKNNQKRFQAGELIHGTVEVIPSEELPLSSLTISFHCLGEVKWVEYPGTPYYLNGFVYYEKYGYMDLEFQIPDAETKKLEKDKKNNIPFEFTVPKGKGLPSSMISTHGFIQYLIKASLQTNNETKKFAKEVIVEVPIEENLMITVGSTVEKNVLLHSGHVTMNASIDRKGFAPGQSIDVHVHVDNKTSARMVPRISLYQSQNYMCGTRHKTVETTLTNDPTLGREIAPHSVADDILTLKIPSDESLTIKSSVITVKYYVHVTLDIPHSFDLHINLPIILTSACVIERLIHNREAAEEEEEDSESNHSNENSTALN